MKKADMNYKKYSEEEGYNPLSNQAFELRLCNAFNKLSTTKNKTHYRYYLIKYTIKNKYVKCDLDHITCDS
jgi:hypothetical protein